VKHAEAYPQRGPANDEVFTLDMLFALHLTSAGLPSLPLLRPDLDSSRTKLHRLFESFPLEIWRADGGRSLGFVSGPLEQDK
jgi:hypothetical protein